MVLSESWYQAAIEHVSFPSEDFPGLELHHRNEKLTDEVPAKLGVDGDECRGRKVEDQDGPKDEEIHPRVCPHVSKGMVVGELDRERRPPREPYCDGIDGSHHPRRSQLRHRGAVPLKAHREVLADGSVCIEGPGEGRGDVSNSRDGRRTGGDGDVGEQGAHGHLELKRRTRSWVQRQRAD